MKIPIKNLEEVEKNGFSLQQSLDLIDCLCFLLVTQNHDKSIQDISTLKDGFLWILRGFSFDDILLEINAYALNFDDFPTPHQIAQRIVKSSGNNKLRKSYEAEHGEEVK